MTTVRTYWLPALLALLAFTTVALLIWPQSEAAPTRPVESRYTGPDFKARKTTAPRSVFIRIGGNGVDNASPVTTEPVPALTGIAGGAAYLRSTTTGEVQRLTRGESLDGWRLLSVQSRQVVLGNGDTEHRLGLFAQAVAPPTDRPDAMRPSPSPSPLPVPSGR